MVTFDCPWCTEPMMVESTDSGELTCEACGVRADLTPEPVADRIARAA